MARNSLRLESKREAGFHHESLVSLSNDADIIVTRTKKYYRSFQYIVNDWAQISRAKGTKLISPTFDVEDGSQWSLKVYPGGRRPHDAPGFISIALMHESPEERSVSYVLYILNQTNIDHETEVPNILYESVDPRPFGPAGSASSVKHIDEFVHTRDIEEVEGLKRDDSVVFGVKLCVYGVHENLMIEHPLPIKAPFRTLREDLSVIFTEHANYGVLSDVTVTVENHSFYCHKAILAARSTVLKEMMEKRKRWGIGKTKVLKLKEISSEVAREMLNYIYTEQCSDNAMTRFAPELLAAAKEYKLTGLYVACEEYMTKTLVPENVVALYLDATKCGALRLEYSCMAFMALHIDEVMKKPSFANLDSMTNMKLLQLSKMPLEVAIATLRQTAVERLHDESRNEIVCYMKVSNEAVRESLTALAMASAEATQDEENPESLPVDKFGDHKASSEPASSPQNDMTPNGFRVTVNDGDDEIDLQTSLESPMRDRNGSKYFDGDGFQEEKTVEGEPYDTVDTYSSQDPAAGDPAEEEAPMKSTPGIQATKNNSTQTATIPGATRA